MEYGFIGGSMGVVVGEKITRAIERATVARQPVIIVSCSGGARMMEGALSLMQMAKISAALARLEREGLLVTSRHGRTLRLVVPPLTARDMEQLFLMVGALNGVAARLAADLAVKPRRA
jgi:hypothetical protein